MKSTVQVIEVSEAKFLEPRGLGSLYTLLTILPLPFPFDYF